MAQVDVMGGSKPSQVTHAELQPQVTQDAFHATRTSSLMQASVYVRMSLGTRVCSIPWQCVTTPIRQIGLTKHIIGLVQSNSQEWPL